MHVSCYKRCSEVRLGVGNMFLSNEESLKIKASEYCKEFNVAIKLVDDAEF
jgi:hypothetical protein